MIRLTGYQLNIAADSQILKWNTDDTDKTNKYVLETHPSHQCSIQSANLRLILNLLNAQLCLDSLLKAGFFKFFFNEL